MDGSTAIFADSLNEAVAAEACTCRFSQDVELCSNDSNIMQRTLHIFEP